jgi:hypothetical protein
MAKINNPYADNIDRIQLLFRAEILAGDIDDRNISNGYH